MKTEKTPLRMVRKSVATAFTLLLILGVIPAATSEFTDFSTTPAAHAQGTIQAPVTVTRVELQSPPNFTIHMSASQAMKMTRLEIASRTTLATRPADRIKGLTVNGESLPTNRISSTGNSLSVEFGNEIEVQPGSLITVSWAAGERRRPSQSSLSVTMEGIEIGMNPPVDAGLLNGEDMAPITEGNPVSGAGFSTITNRRRWDECSQNSGLLYAKTWWDPSPETAEQGGVDVVEVAVNGVSNLSGRVNVNDPRLKLRFGSDNDGWQELRKDEDYTLTVSGGSVYFTLKTTQNRAPLAQVSYDVEAYIPLRDSATGCRVNLWHKEETGSQDNHNPVLSASHREVPNSRRYDQCHHNNGLLFAKTWWDKKWATTEHGGVDVVEVAVNGVSNLSGRVNVNDPRLKLRFGSDNDGWQELRKDEDYTLTVSGGSVYFTLKTTNRRPSEKQVSYDVEAYIPLRGSQTGCQIIMWKEKPQWFNPDAGSIDLTVGETPTTELRGWLPESLPNPTATPRCGAKIALVFDTSDSLGRNNAIGAISSVEAGRRVIDALEGSGSEMAIYNFASAAKSVPAMSTDTLSLNDADSVKKLRNAVTSLTRPFTRNGRGGTNYEAGLGQVPSGEFDTVYFITDGLPTTSSRDYPYGFDIGNLINQSDLSAAVKEANRLKNSGTRIETIMAGFEPFDEYILKDDYFQVASVEHQKTPAVSGVTTGIAKPWPHLEGIGYPSYYGQADSVRELVTTGEITIRDTPDRYKAVKYDITNQPEIWRAAVRNTKTIASDISSPDAVTTVAQFTDLAKNLSELVLQNCFGTLSVTKKIQNDDGTLTPGADWTFTTTVDDQQNVIIDGDDRKSSVTDVTDQNGDFGRSIDQSGRRGYSVNVVEQQQSEYTLQKQGDKNAVCTAQVFKGEGKGWETTKPNLVNIDDGRNPGFRVDIPFRGNVHCTIVNAKQLDVSITVQKVDAADKSVPLGGAEFLVNKIPAAESWPRTITEGTRTVSGLKHGETYELIETKAPEGFQLLTKAVRFSIQRGEKGPQVVLEGGEEQYPQIKIKPNEANKQQAEFIMQVADIRKGDLPLVGGIGVGWMAFAAGIVAVAAIFLGRRSLS